MVSSPLSPLSPHSSTRYSSGAVAAMGKGNSQQSQVESSVKRLLKRLKRKDKSPTVDPKKPVESPKPAATPPVAAPGVSRRLPKPKRRPGHRKSRYEEEYGSYREEEHEADSTKPRWKPAKPSWYTKREWSNEALTVAGEFLARYAEMGVEGIKEEFKKEIEGYRSPDYADTLWKANPTKNGDKNYMACLDGSRYEFSKDKKRYINANWLYDTQLVSQKYILTQEPIVPLAKGDSSTIDDFWEMVHAERVTFAIMLSQTKKYEERKNGIFGEMLGSSFYPPESNEGKPVELADFYLESKIYPTTVHVSPKVCPVEDNHEHPNKAINKGCEKLSQMVKVFDLTDWTETSLLNILYTISQLKSREQLPPLVLMDEYSGTSGAAILVAVDVLGNLLWTAHKDVTLASIVKWMRRCRNGAIRTADEYVFIINVLIRGLYNKPSLKKTEKLTAMYAESVKDEKNHDRLKELVKRLPEREKEIGLGEARVEFAKEYEKLRKK